jgi:hypothetical protein
MKNVSRHVAPMMTAILLFGCAGIPEPGPTAQQQAQIRQGKGIHESFTVPQKFETALQNLQQVSDKCFPPDSPLGRFGAETTVAPDKKSATILLGWKTKKWMRVWFVVDLTARDNKTDVHTFGYGSTGSYKNFGIEVKSWVADPKVCDPKVPGA